MRYSEIPIITQAQTVRGIIKTSMACERAASLQVLRPLGDLRASVAIEIDDAAVQLRGLAVALRESEHEAVVDVVATMRDAMAMISRAEQIVKEEAGGRDAEAICDDRRNDRVDASTMIAEMAKVILAEMTAWQQRGQEND